MEKRTVGALRHQLLQLVDEVDVLRFAFHKRKMTECAYLASRLLVAHTWACERLRAQETSGSMSNSERGPELDWQG